MEKKEYNLDLTIPFGAYDSELIKTTYYIPEGYEAKIEGNEIIIKKKGVKPLFKAGDWIVNNETKEVHRIVDYNEQYKIYKTEEDVIFSVTAENMWHKWTLLDAKKGDILSDETGIIIFRGIGNKAYIDVVDYYVDYTYGNSSIRITEDNQYWGKVKSSTLIPATKEQKERLFKKLAEAGYEFDAEKKDLRKKVWEPKDGETYFYYFFDNKEFCFKTDSCICFESSFERDLGDSYKLGNYFQTEEEAQAFCDKLNAAIKPVIDERKKEIIP